MRTSRYKSEQETIPNNTAEALSCCAIKILVDSKNGLRRTRSIPTEVQYCVHTGVVGSCALRERGLALWAERNACHNPVHNFAVQNCVLWIFQYNAMRRTMVCDCRPHCRPLLPRYHAASVVKVQTRSHPAHGESGAPTSSEATPREPQLPQVSST
jgi:hypothetical protein